MTITVTDVVRDWVSVNVHSIDYPSEDQIDPEAKRLAQKCAADAAAEGISLEEIENQFGSLPVSE